MFQIGIGEIECAFKDKSQPLGIPFIIERNTKQGCLAEKRDIVLVEKGTWELLLHCFFRRCMDAGK